MQLNPPELAEVLDEIEFFEQEQTDCQYLELAIPLYNHGRSLRKIACVLGCIGVDLSYIAICKVSGSPVFQETNTVVGRVLRVEPATATTTNNGTIRGECRQP